MDGRFSKSEKLPWNFPPLGIPLTNIHSVLKIRKMLDKARHFLISGSLARCSIFLDLVEALVNNIIISYQRLLLFSHRRSTRNWKMSAIAPTTNVSFTVNGNDVQVSNANPNTSGSDRSMDCRALKGCVEKEGVDVV